MALTHFRDAVVKGNDAQAKADRQELKALKVTMQALIDAQAAAIADMQLIIDAQAAEVVTIQAVIDGVDASTNAQLRNMVKDLAREAKTKAGQVGDTAKSIKGRCQDIREASRGVRNLIRVIG